MDDVEKKLKDKFINDFINNVRFADVVKLVAEAADKYAEEKIKNPKKFLVIEEKKEKKYSLLDKFKSLFSNKEKDKNSKKISSKKG